MANPLGITLEEVQSRAPDDFEQTEIREIESQIDQTVRLLVRPPRRQLAAWIAAGTVDRESVIDVVWRAISRVSEGSAFKSEREGEYSYEANPLAASGDIWIPDADLALVTPPAASHIGTARVRPSRIWAGY